MGEERSVGCKDLPALIDAFVDVFVDFCVSGLFLSHDTNTHSTDLRTKHPSPDRLIAIGDLHGDLQKSKEALKIAGLIDDSDRWIGGHTTVVQIGDVLDRGGDELKIFYFLEKLKRDAARSGGSVLTMNGNHEIMNVNGDFRFVTRSGLDEFRVWGDWFRLGVAMKSLCKELNRQKDVFAGIPKVFPGIRAEFHEGFRARIAALRPDGPISRRFLSENSTVLIVGDSVFAHGGLLQHHVLYGLEKVNEEVRDWIKGSNGRSRYSPEFVTGKDSIVWLRKFSLGSSENCDCATLEHVLATIPGAKRMIMGHTIQESGINGVCENRAIRIDVGMSKGCVNGLPEVLEINGNSELRILTSNPLYQSSSKSSLKDDGKGGLGLLIPEQGLKPVEVNA